jgi:hypothetical protein
MFTEALDCTGVFWPEAHGRIFFTCCVTGRAARQDRNYTPRKVLIVILVTSYSNVGRLLRGKNAVTVVTRNHCEVGRTPG